MSGKPQNYEAHIHAKEELVTFNHVLPLNLVEGDMTVTYNIGSRLSVGPLDWVGLFQSNSRDCSKPVASLRAPPEPKLKTKPQERHLTFPAKLIQPLAHKTLTYYCQYVTENNRVLGATQPFKLIEDADDLDVRSELSQLCKSHASHSANQDAISHLSELLSSDDEWEFASHSAIQRSNSITSDISDIVILSSSPSKEAVKMEPGCCKFEEDTSCLCDDEKIRRELEQAKLEDPIFLVESTSGADHDKPHQKVTVPSPEESPLQATKSSNKISNNKLHALPVTKQTAENKQDHQPDHNEQTNVKKCNKTSTKKSQTGHSKKQHTLTNSRDEEPINAAKEALIKVSDNRVNLFDTSQRQTTSLQQSQALATSEPDVRSLGAPHKVKHNRLKQKQSPSRKEVMQHPLCEWQIKATPNKAIVALTHAEGVQELKRPKAESEEQDCEGAGTKQKCAKKFKKKGDKKKKMSAVVCEKREFKGEEKRRELARETLKEATPPEGRSGQGLKTGSQREAAEGGDNSSAKLKESCEADLEIASGELEKCKKVQRKGRKVREKFSRREGKKNKLGAAWMSESLLDRCFEDVSDGYLGVEESDTEADQNDVPVVNCFNSHDLAVLFTGTEDNTIANETERIEEKISNDEGSDRKKEGEGGIQGGCCLKGEWSIALANLMNAQPLVSTRLEDRHKIRKMATTARPTVKCHPTFKSKYKFKFSKRDEVQRARTIQKWLLLNKARAGRLQKQLFGKDNTFSAVELPKPSQHHTTGFTFTNQVTRSKSLQPIRPASPTLPISPKSVLANPNPKPNIFSQKWNPNVSQTKSVVFMVPFPVGNIHAGPVIGENPKEERMTYASVVKQSMDEHRQQKLLAIEQHQLDTATSEIPSSGPSTTQQKDLEQREVLHRTPTEPQEMLIESHTEVVEMKKRLACDLKQSQEHEVVSGILKHSATWEQELTPEQSDSEICLSDETITAPKYGGVLDQAVPLIWPVPDVISSPNWLQPKACCFQAVRDLGFNAAIVPRRQEIMDIAEVHVQPATAIRLGFGKNTGTGLSLFGESAPDLSVVSAQLSDVSLALGLSREENRDLRNRMNILEEQLKSAQPLASPTRHKQRDTETRRGKASATRCQDKGKFRNVKHVRLPLGRTQGSIRTLTRSNIETARLKSKVKSGETKTPPDPQSQIRANLAAIKNITKPLQVKVKCKKLKLKINDHRVQLKTGRTSDGYMKLCFTQDSAEGNNSNTFYEGSNVKPCSGKENAVIGSCDLLETRVPQEEFHIKTLHSDHRDHFETNHASKFTPHYPINEITDESANTTKPMTNAATRTHSLSLSSVLKSPINPGHEEWLKPKTTHLECPCTGPTLTTKSHCDASWTLQLPRPSAAYNGSCLVFDGHDSHEENATRPEIKRCSSMQQNHSCESCDLDSHHSHGDLFTKKCSQPKHQTEEEDAQRRSSHPSSGAMYPQRAESSPGMKPPECSSPGMKPPECSSPGMKPPECSSPGMKPPECSSPGMKPPECSSPENRCRNLISRFINPFFTSGSSSHRRSFVQPFLWKTAHKVQSRKDCSSRCEDMNQFQPLVSNNCSASEGTVEARPDILMFPTIVESSVDGAISEIGIPPGQSEYIMLGETPSHRVSNVPTGWSNPSKDFRGLDQFCLSDSDRGKLECAELARSRVNCESSLPNDEHVCHYSRCQNCSLRQLVPSGFQNDQHSSTNPDCPIHGDLLHQPYCYHFNNAAIAWLPLEHSDCSASPCPQHANTKPVDTTAHYLFHAEYTPESTTWPHDTSCFQQTPHPYNYQQTPYPSNFQQTPCPNLMNCNRKQHTSPHDLTENTDNSTAIRQLHSLPKQNNDSTHDSQFCDCSECKRQIEAMSHCHETCND